MNRWDDIGDPMSRCLAVPEESLNRDCERDVSAQIACARLTYVSRSLSPATDAREKHHENPCLSEDLQQNVELLLYIVNAQSGNTKHAPDLWKSLTLHAGSENEAVVLYDSANLCVIWEKDNAEAIITTAVPIKMGEQTTFNNEGFSKPEPISPADPDHIIALNQSGQKAKFMVGSVDPAHPTDGPTSVFATFTEVGDNMSIKVEYPAHPQLQLFARLDQQPGGGIEGYVQSNGPIFVQDLTALADKELFAISINPQGTVTLVASPDAEGPSQVQLPGDKRETR
ncbi:hypothetical protein BKA70DRAFT_291960 [Coprinopsis sp. MPI-PUGE-AT-0042]|nr:hypothetical protein BKA70DRAFT_291960 [Coprinopsis sp. MPI-PUGE-AT-0042]